MRSSASGHRSLHRFSDLKVGVYHSSEKMYKIVQNNRISEIFYGFSLKGKEFCQRGARILQSGTVSEALSAISPELETKSPKSVKNPSVKNLLFPFVNRSECVEAPLPFGRNQFTGR